MLIKNSSKVANTNPLTLKLVKGLYCFSKKVYIQPQHYTFPLGPFPSQKGTNICQLPTIWLDNLLYRHYFKSLKNTFKAHYLDQKTRYIERPLTLQGRCWPSGRVPWLFRGTEHPRMGYSWRLSKRLLPPGRPPWPFLIPSENWS